METNLKLLVAQVNDLKAQIDQVRPLSHDQELRIFQKFRLDWNYHSNAIEGNSLTPGETRVFLMEGLTANGKPLKDHLDIRGHNQVIDYLLDFVRGKEILTEAAIREMHKLLLVETYKAVALTPEGAPTEKWINLGQYKSTPNQVTTSTGEVRRFVLPEETPLKMQELVEGLRIHSIEHEEHEGVYLAAIFHHKFVAIHPFDDGNGRMARLLMNLILMQHGYPPIVIKMNERETYFAALAQADAGEMTPFLSFIAQKAIDSMELYLKGARGEPLEEDDDIDKKIRLLKQELASHAEPVVFSESTYKEILNGSFKTLFLTCCKKLQQYQDLFISSKLNLYAHVAGPPKAMASGLSPGAIDKLLLELEKLFPKLIVIHFQFESFKKSGVHTFDCSVYLKVKFERLTYSIEAGRAPIFKNLYEKPLSHEESMAAANSLAEDIFTAITRERISNTP